MNSKLVGIEAFKDKFQNDGCSYKGIHTLKAPQIDSEEKKIETSNYQSCTVQSIKSSSRCIQCDIGR